MNMNMNMEPGPKISIHVPFAIFALAVAVFLGAQISSIRRAAETMAWQRGNLDSQGEDLSKAKVRLDELIKQGGESVKQAAKVEEQFTTFFKDVVDLAATDQDARAVVEKWQIKLQAPPAAAVGGSDAKKD